MLPLPETLIVVLIPETSFYGPGEFLLHKDDLLDSVFYITRGSMEVLDKDIVVAILGGYLAKLAIPVLSTLTPKLVTLTVSPSLSPVGQIGSTNPS
jgi:hypothetical protein